MIKLKEGPHNSEVKGYTIVRLLGKGQNAEVFEVLKEGQKESAAAKFLSRAILNKDPQRLKLANSEWKILKAIKNENVVRFIDHFLTKQNLVIVMEYCEGGELQTYITNKGRLTEYEATNFLKQILNGFKGLHEANVMHRDFKASNVMFSNGILKIVDLGFAKVLKEQDLTQTLLGTKFTMAPQLLKGTKYSWKADIWSVGVVFYQMIYGEYPYIGHSDDDILKKIKQQRPNYSKVNISDNARDFIERCLTVDPDKRISWKQIYLHPILEQSKIPFGLRSTLKIQENQKFYNRESIQNVMKQEKQKKLREQQQKEQWTQGYEQTIEQQKIKELRDERLQLSQKQLAIKEFQRVYLSRRSSIMFIFKEIVPWMLKCHSRGVKANNIIALFIMCKRAYHNLLILAKQLAQGQNILGKSQYFQEFLASKQFKDMREQVETDCFLIRIQAEELKTILPENLNEATRIQLNFQIIANPIWSAFVEQTVEGYESELIDALDSEPLKDAKLKREVIRLIQGLHYYCHYGSDADVEQFDKYMESLSYEQSELRMRERQLKSIHGFQE